MDKQKLPDAQLNRANCDMMCGYNTITGGGVRSGGEKKTFFHLFFFHTKGAVSLSLGYPEGLLSVCEKGR